MNIRIEFDYIVEGAPIKVRLYADATLDSATSIYHIRHIGIRDHQNVLPNISIRKRRDEWIHTDSRKETQLSRAIGEALDKVQETKSVHHLA